MKYYRPKTLNEYYELLTSLNTSNYKILAGGTDLMPRFDRGLAMPEHLIDIKKIPDLCGITENKKQIEIGASTSIEELRKSEIIKKNFYALWQSTSDFAAVQIRHRATIGGNICNASPAADTLPALYVHKAKLKLVKKDAERKVLIRDFILRPGQIDLASGELLHSIIIPKTGLNSYFYKLGLREAMAIAVVSFAVIYKYTEDHFSDLSVAAGAVAPTIVFLKSFTDALEGRAVLPAECTELIDKDISPISDLRASAKYRRQVLKNMLPYTLKNIRENTLE